MDEYILEMKKIVKKFPGTIALKQVDINLKKGEILALIGENGAGKSTLMNVLIGNLIADEGEIIYKGETIVNKTPLDALKRKIAMVPQELNLAQELTVAENIFLGSHIKKNGIVDWESMYKEASALLGQLELSIEPRRKVKELSAAYQQLLVIARTLHTGADLIIFDEPTASLTLNETEHILKIIKNLAKSGKSIVIITHHLDEVKDVSDRVCILRDGTMVMEKNTDGLSVDDMIFYMANQKVKSQKHVERKYSDENILEVHHLSRPNEFEDISFCVKKGEIFGITGLVGSGRTELINCIYGLTKKHGGTIKFEEKEVEIHAPRDAINLGIGLVPEERRRDGIFPLLSVQENMILPSYHKYRNKGVLSFKDIKRNAQKGIDNLQIKTSSENEAIKNLSGGNQQKVILARWVEKDLKLLFLDEPTRGIDVRAKGEIYNLIRSMADQGFSVVIVSSEIDEILVVADRIMVMFEGNMKGIVEGPDVADMTRTNILKMSLS